MLQLPFGARFRWAGIYRLWQYQPGPAPRAGAERHKIKKALSLPTPHATAPSASRFGRPRVARPARRRAPRGTGRGPHYLSVKKHFIGSRIDGSRALKSFWITRMFGYLRVAPARNFQSVERPDAARETRGDANAKRQGRQRQRATAPLELLARPDAPRTPNPDARVARNLAVSRAQDLPPTYRSPTP